MLPLPVAGFYPKNCIHPTGGPSPEHRLYLYQAEIPFLCSATAASSITPTKHNVQLSSIAVVQDGDVVASLINAGAVPRRFLKVDHHQNERLSREATDSIDFASYLSGHDKTKGDGDCGTNNGGEGIAAQGSAADKGYESTQLRQETVRALQGELCSASSWGYKAGRKETLRFLAIPQGGPAWRMVGNG
ncbi:hypothetical protein SUNI508_01766 [Seiridium unicorne]|uniref:Uncharacterized protein n=1 Tax=Seiridium unicorne TaxID=138068 RepID=A0ABR2UPA6_9PEZI